MQTDIVYVALAYCIPAHFAVLSYTSLPVTGIK